MKKDLETSEDISKALDNNIEGSAYIKLKEAQIKISKLTSLSSTQEKEISSLKSISKQIQEELSKNDLEFLNLQVQHLQCLNSALEERCKENQSKIKNLSNQNPELSLLKSQMSALLNDKSLLEDSLKNYKEQAMMAEYEKSYLQNRNKMLEKRLKNLNKEPKIIIPKPVQSSREQASTSLSSALKLFKEFPITRGPIN